MVYPNIGLYIYIYPMIQPHGIDIYIYIYYIYISKMAYCYPIIYPFTSQKLLLGLHYILIHVFFNTNFIDAIYPTFFWNMLNVVSHYAIYIPFH